MANPFKILWHRWNFERSLKKVNKIHYIDSELDPKQLEPKKYAQKLNKNLAKYQDYIDSADYHLSMLKELDTPDYYYHKKFFSSTLDTVSKTLTGNITLAQDLDLPTDTLAFQKEKELVHYIEVAQEKLGIKTIAFVEQYHKAPPKLVAPVPVKMIRSLSADNIPSNNSSKPRSNTSVSLPVTQEEKQHAETHSTPFFSILEGMKTWLKSINNILENMRSDEGPSQDIKDILKNPYNYDTSHNNPSSPQCSNFTPT